MLSERSAEAARSDGHGWGWNSGFDLFADYLVRVIANDGKPSGRPRIDGVAADIVAARQWQAEARQKEKADAARK